MLGGCGAWPEPGRACSGFLLEHDGFRVVLDLGYGTASRLLGRCPGGEVDAVVVTHEHPDHCVDLSALARVRYYAGSKALPLYCPPGVVRVLRELERNPDPGEVFDLRTPPTAPATRPLGPFQLTTIALPHHVPNLGVRLTTAEHAIAYTGDCGSSPLLAELGRDADLFVMDATLWEPSGEPHYLMTAEEAAGWAKRAGAKRLLLTHFWPGTNRDVAVTRARAVFPGEVLAADEDTVVAL